MMAAVEAGVVFAALSYVTSDVRGGDRSNHVIAMSGIRATLGALLGASRPVE